MSDAIFTSREYATFVSMVTVMGRDSDPWSVAADIAMFGAPREALDAMATKFGVENGVSREDADHALAYGEHSKAQCGEWCSFPTGNER
jgi:hypothetical protein